MVSECIGFSESNPVVDMLCHMFVLLVRIYPTHSCPFILHYLLTLTMYAISLCT